MNSPRFLARHRRLCIGLPVYNSARTIAEALDSLLAQRDGDFLLFISDNASTDGTAAILRRYADRDRRIVYFRQAANIGAVRNFEFVLRRSHSPFFMWAAADDRWSEGFVGDNLAHLLSAPALVCSVSRTDFLIDGQRKAAEDTYPLPGPLRRDLCAYLDNPSTNSRFYGIFRHGPLVRACAGAFGEYLACDWAVMAGTLAYGRHGEIGRPQLLRHSGGASSKIPKSLWRYHQPPLTFLFPMAEFSLTILRNHQRELSPRLLLILFRHNLKYMLLWFMPIIMLLPASLRARLKCRLGMKP